MKLWQYYGIGSGNFQLFSKNWSFQSGLKVVTHFIKCADNIEPTTAEAKNSELRKQRKHKQVVIANCVILFFALLPNALQHLRHLMSWKATLLKEFTLYQKLPHLLTM